MNEYFKLAQTDKFIGNKVKPLTLDNLVHNQFYSVSIKLDGLRYLLFIDKNNKLFLINNKLELIDLQYTLKIDNYNNSIFDCEVISHEKYSYIYIFDCIIYNNIDLRFSTEDNYLPNRINYYNNFINYINLNCKLNDIFFFAKLHYLNTSYNKLYSDCITLLKFKNHNTPIDGLIMTPIYHEYSYKITPLKWKFQNTIDFKIKLLEEVKKTYKTALYTSGDNLFTETFLNFTDIKNLKLIDGDIVEFYWDYDTKIFKPLRKRADKIEGNYLEVVKSNFELIKHPFLLENFLKIREVSTFYNLRLYHNYIKNTIITSYTPPPANNKYKILIDLATGKGGDINKWINNKYNKVLGYDINKNSIKTAIIRKDIILKKKLIFKPNINFYTLDLSNHILNLNIKADLITCFFALHYFFKSENSLYNLLKSVVNNLKKDSYFIGSVFDKSKVLKFIKNKTQIKEFSIKVLNTNNEVFDNKIEVFIKNTVLTEPTIEYLVDLKHLTNIALKFNLKLVKFINFKEFDYKNYNLSTYEKKLSFLNTIFIFQKL